MAKIARRRRAARALPGGIVLGIAVVLCVTAPSAASAQAAEIVVSTPQGTLRGSIDGDVRRFAGIPFAAPPVGDLRWRPPQSPPRWDGVRDATTFGNQCVQPSGGSEDCLYLNVYTPAAGMNLPVMVWIHGGGFTFGAASMYDPTPLVSGGGVIVVTVNYRLGALGALALPELDAEAREAVSGTYALLDQQAALRWVRDNIAAFGGDPGNVTIFGQSAGAAYVCLNVASPPAAGLFHAAISQSGCAQPTTRMSEARRFGLAVAGRLGCARGALADLACLRSKSPAQIDSAATAAAGGSAGIQKASTPVAGGAALPRNVIDAFTSGRFNKVPLLVGLTRHEGRAFVAAAMYGSPPTDEASYLAALRGLDTATADRVAAEYPLSQYLNASEALATLLGDMSFACTSLRPMELAAAHVPVFGYEFNDPGATPLGAAHASELPYLFAMTRRPGPLAPPATPSAAQQALSGAMVGYWTSFARTRQPVHANAPDWPRYVIDEPLLLSLAPDEIGPIPAGDVGARHHCAFWDSVR